MAAITPLRIGDVLLPGQMTGSPHVVSCGGLWSFFVASSGASVLVDAGLPPRQVEIDSHFEQALGPEFGYRRGGREDIEHCLSAEGLEISSIDVIILTHLHHDHAGGVAWMRGPEIWVHERERLLLEGPYRRWLGPDWQVTGELHRALENTAHDRKLHWWKGDSVDLVDDVSLLWVGGHTPGSAAVMVDRPSERVALAGDILLTEDHARAGEIPTVSTNLIQTVDGVRKVISQADQMWTGHSAHGAVSTRELRSVWNA